MMFDTVQYWTRIGGLSADWRRDQFHKAGIKIIGAAAGEQIDAAEAAMHLRLDLDGSPPAVYEQSWIDAAITTSREIVEGLCGLLLSPQVVELALPGFPNVWHWGDIRQPGISLITGPLLGVTSVTYQDADNATQTVTDAAYVLDDYVRPPVVYPAYGVAWPSALCTHNSVKIRCAMGYNLPGDSPQDQPLPRSLKHAMLLVLGHYYENRDSTSELNLALLPLGVTALTERYRIRTSMA